MAGMRDTAVPCAIGNVMSLIAITAIRGTSEQRENRGVISPALSIAFVGEPCIERFLNHPRLRTFLILAELDETSMQFGWTGIAVVYEFLVAVSSEIWDASR